MAGKGDSPRPVDGDTYRANWERIFGAHAEVAQLAERHRAKVEAESSNLSFRSQVADWVSDEAAVAACERLSRFRDAMRGRDGYSGH